VVEVHLSDVSQREEWRRTSVIADVVSHRIAGRGAEGYRDAFTYLAGERG
jgi:3-dehydroquinate dehydratase-2